MERFRSIKMKYGYWELRLSIENIRSKIEFEKYKIVREHTRISNLSSFLERRNIAQHRVKYRKHIWSSLLRTTLHCSIFIIHKLYNIHKYTNIYFEWKKMNRYFFNSLSDYKDLYLLNVPISIDHWSQLPSFLRNLTRPKKKRKKRH